MVLPKPRRRQPLLFESTGPWPSRFGAAFFREIPALPGVYFFHDAAGVLLYIGQSGCLRDRIGSYRHVDPRRNAKRTLRLIQRCVRIEWRICDSAAEAVALEAALLLENRPPFNRAGVWPASDCWFGMSVEDGRLELRCARSVTASDTEYADDGNGGVVWSGPLPGRFRWAFAPLVRFLFQAMHPGARLWEFPPGLMAGTPSPVQSWRMPPDNEAVLKKLTDFLECGCPALVEGFQEAAPALATDGAVGEFWAGQMELLVKFSQAHSRRLADSDSVDSAPRELHVSGAV